MKKRSILITLATFGLLLSGLVGCGNKQSEEPAPSSKPDETSQKSEQSSQESKSSEKQSSSSEEKSSSQQSSSEAPHEHSYAKVGESVHNVDGKEVYVMECADKDDKYIAIAFHDYSALDPTTALTDATTKYSSVTVEDTWLIDKNQTVSWKINVDKAISGAKIVFGVVMTSSSHSTQGYDENGTVKYSFKVNDGEFVDWDLKGLTYGDYNLSPKSMTYVEYGSLDLAAGENTITLRQNNAGYRLVYGGEVRIHYSGDAKPVEAPIPFEGYNVTFTVEHCKVLVYNTKAYETETPVETLTCKARDEEGNIVAYDPEDIELQPQVSFKVVCDEGYSVTVNNVTITPRENYKNLKQNPDNVTGQEDIFRATKIQGDITIAIVAQAGEQAKGYKITFNTTNCTVKVYVGPKNADGTNIDTPEDGVYYARIKDSPYDIGFTTPQLNFEVVCETGFTFTATPDENNKVDFIVGDYNKFSDKGGYYNLTKIASDLTITIVAVAA